MTTRLASDLLLAADLSCSGLYSPVGIVREPSLALSVAVRDLLLYRENPELKHVVLHVLATRVAGRCIIRGPHIRRALKESMTSRVTLEWKITVPTVGSVRALFLITRFSRADQSDLFDLVLQLAGKPAFDAAKPMEAKPLEAKPAWQACSLLRIF